MLESEFRSKLETIGWLDASTQEERTRLHVALADAYGRNPDYAFYALAVTSFDPECIESTGPEDSCSYYSVISQLVAASSGRFAPTDLHDELDGAAGVARISFRCVGNVFACEVPWEDDWFKGQVLDLVNDAMTACKVPEQFIALPPCDQTISLVLVSPEVYEKAVSVALIPQNDILEDSSTPHG